MISAETEAIGKVLEEQASKNRLMGGSSEKSRLNYIFNGALQVRGCICILSSLCHRGTTV